ncbi:hypothetical protein DYB35_006716 [Aphanomyces astaci]|uniref:Potassium channel domain-containing protein n=1 Tax=Aphanomyces astaci TaxID=112090 RepID=A0A3R7B4Q0_APHAT|nr:hypothetical protein DYB35_006716 [Aphanomyces astaci]
MTTDPPSTEDLWQKKKRVYAQQLTDRLKDDEAFKRSFVQTAEHVRAIHKLNLDYNNRRTVEQSMCAISAASVLLVFVDCAVDTPWIRVVNTALTVALLCLLIRRYTIEVHIAIGKGTLPSDVRLHELPSSVILGFLVEFLICSLTVPPFITNGSFSVQQWITRAQVDPITHAYFCKFDGVLLGRDCYLLYSYPYRIAFIGSLNNVDALGTLFAIKYLLRTNPFTLLSLGFLSSLLTTACAVWIVEAPVNPLVSTYGNAVWLTVVTMATVGYGDKVPVTVAGQVVMIVFAMVSGILLTGMLSASFFAMLELTAADVTVFGLLDKEKQAKQTANASATLIQAAWNLHSCGRHHPPPLDHANAYQAASVLLYATAQVCRKLRKSRPLHVPSTTEQLDGHFGTVRKNMHADFASRKARLLALEAELDAVQL